MAGLGLSLGFGLVTSAGASTPAVPFDFTQVDGDPAFWLDPAVNDEWTMSGANLTSAPDLFGEGHTFSPQSGNVVLTTAATNGVPALSLASAVMQGSAGLVDIAKAPHIIFMAVEIINNPTTTQRLVYNQAGGTGRSQIFFNSGTSGNNGVQWRYGNTPQNTVITAGNAGLSAGIHIIMFGLNRSLQRFVRMGNGQEAISSHTGSSYNSDTTFIRFGNGDAADLKILGMVGWYGDISDYDKNRVANKLVEDKGGSWVDIDGSLIRKLPIGLPTPAWLTSYLPGFEIMFPSFFNNDSVRATLPGVPSTKYSLLYSSDHSTGTGYNGRADFDSFEGTWTDFGDSILTGVNQLETPNAIFDYVDQDRILLYAHEDVGNGVGPYSTQSTGVYETTDLENFTYIGKIENYSHHSGYARAMWEAGNNRYSITMTYSAHENGIRQRAISNDGLTYTLQQFIYPNNAAILPEGYLLDGSTKIFQYDDGQWYMVGVLMERPRLSPSSAGEGIIVVPIDYETLRPVGGYRTLVIPGKNSSLTDDVTLKNYFDYEKIDGEWCLVYGTPKGIMRAKGGINLEATPTTPVVAIESNGEISRPAVETTILDWDAANDAVPAGLTITAVAGTNASSQSAGNYYELKAGTSASETLRMYNTTAVDISEYDWVEVTFENLTMDVLTQSASIKKFFMMDAFTSENGFIFSDDNNNFLRFRAMASGSASVDKDSYGVPYGTDGSALNLQWRLISRSSARKFAIAVDLVNEKLILLLDDNIVYVRDYSGDSLTLNDMLCGVELNDTASSGDPYIRFSRFTIKAYT